MIINSALFAPSGVAEKEEQETIVRDEETGRQLILRGDRWEEYSPAPEGPPSETIMRDEETGRQIVLRNGAWEEYSPSPEAPPKPPEAPTVPEVMAQMGPQSALTGGPIPRRGGFRETKEYQPGEIPEELHAQLIAEATPGSLTRMKQEELGPETTAAFAQKVGTGQGLIQKDPIMSAIMGGGMAGFAARKAGAGVLSTLAQGITGAGLAVPSDIAIEEIAESAGKGDPKLTMAIAVGVGLLSGMAENKILNKVASKLARGGPQLIDLVDNAKSGNPAANKALQELVGDTARKTQAEDVIDSANLPALARKISPEAGDVKAAVNTINPDDLSGAQIFKAKQAAAGVAKQDLYDRKLAEFSVTRARPDTATMLKLDSLVDENITLGDLVVMASEKPGEAVERIRMSPIDIGRLHEGLVNKGSAIIARLPRAERVAAGKNLQDIIDRLPAIGALREVPQPTGVHLEAFGFQSLYERTMQAGRDIVKAIGGAAPGEVLEESAAEIAKSPVKKLTAAPGALKDLLADTVTGREAARNKDVRWWKAALMRDHWIPKGHPEGMAIEAITDELMENKASDVATIGSRYFLNERGKHVLRELPKEEFRKLRDVLFLEDREGFEHTAGELRRTGLSDQAIDAYGRVRAFFDGILEDKEQFLLQHADDLKLDKNKIRALMVDIRKRKGYMPRIRPSKAWVVYATKEGQVDFRTHANIFDRNVLKKNLEAKGYTVNIKRLLEFPEDLSFDLGRANLAGLVEQVSNRNILHRTRQLAIDISELLPKSLGKNQQLAVAELLLQDAGEGTLTREAFKGSSDVWDAFKNVSKTIAGDRRYKDILNAISDTESAVRQIQDVGDSVLQSVADTFAVRGFLRHGQHRIDKYVEGFETDDLIGITNNMLTGYAGWKNKIEASLKYGKAIAQIDAFDKPILAKWANEHVKEILRNTTMADRVSGKIRSIAYAKYILGVPKSVFLNLTQSQVTTAPKLTGILRRGGKGPLVSSLQGEEILHRSATQIAVGGRGLSAEENGVMDLLEQKGLFHDQMTQEFMGATPGEFRELWGKMVDVLGWGFSKAEIYNRKIAALSGYRAYRKIGQSVEEATQNAKMFVSDTQFKYGKANLLKWEKGSVVGAPAGGLVRASRSLKSYGGNLFSFWHNEALQEKNYLGLMQSLGALTALGGAVAIPMADKTLDKVYDWTGLDVKRTARDALPDFWWKSAAFGVPAALGIDLSGSMQMQLPFTGERTLKESITEEVLGVPGSMVEDIYRGSKLASRGHLGRGLEISGPKGLSGPLRAVREAREGMTTQKGYPVLGEDEKPLMPTTGESVIRGLGAQPARPAILNKIRSLDITTQQMYSERKNAIMEDLRFAQARGDDEARKEAMKQLVELQIWAKKRDILAPRMTIDTIRRSMAGKRTKRERQFMKRYIKESEE